MSNLLKNVTNPILSPDESVSPDGEYVADLHYKTAAEMALQAYAQETQRMAVVNGYVYIPFLSTKDIAVYEDQFNGQNVVIAHRGTDLDSNRKFGDLFQDSLIATGTGTRGSRYHSDLASSKKVYSVFKGRTVIHTGHSLGGYMANQVAHALDGNGFKSNSIVFNPGSSPMNLFQIFDKQSGLHNLFAKEQGSHVVLRNDKDWIAAGAKLGLHRNDRVYRFKGNSKHSSHTVTQFLDSYK